MRLRRLIRCSAQLVAILAMGVGCLTARAADPVAWSPTRESPAASIISLPLAAGQWRLDHHREAAPGDPPFVLRDANGAVYRKVEPTRKIDLQAYVGQPVGILHDSGETLLASQLQLGVAATTSVVSLPQPATVVPAQHLASDPTTPIILEELPLGQPALSQPSTLAPAERPMALPPIDAYESNEMACQAGQCAAPGCGDVCSPYSYSASPGTLAQDLSQLGHLGWGLTKPRKWLGCHPQGQPGRIDFGGWTQLGYHSDSVPLSQTTGDLRAFNDVPSGVRWQQQWLWIGRQADGRAGPDWGFRFDLLYGTDAQKAQAFGNQGLGTPYGLPADTGSWDASLDHGEYGWAMPQLYGQVADGDWSVIFGHFLTPVGYEVLPAPENFFYSHSLTMFNSEPFTHTGILATYAPQGEPHGLELYGGYTLGWDTGFDQSAGGSTFIGGWSLRPLPSVTLAYLTTIGNLGARSGGGSGYTHSLVADVAVTKRLNYVLQTDYVDYNDQTGTGLRDDQIGINNYLLLAINRQWGAGARLEWWKFDGNSYFEMTYGLNYRPLTGLVFRPELRYDWSADGAALGADRLTFGVDAVLVY